MLAEMTWEKGRLCEVPLDRMARYSSDLTANSPRTAYLAALTWGLMLSMLSRLPEEASEAIVRVW